MSRRLNCLSLHAERLEDDYIWEVTSATLKSLERLGGRATLFVHPFTALEAGADLKPRLDELAERGHELGQHTHYYAHRVTSSGVQPVSLLAESNVIRCLERDYSYLQKVGVEPKGFVAGAWKFHPAARKWLIDRGFTYNATVRSFRLSYPNPDAAWGNGWQVPRTEDGIVWLPTTGATTDAFPRSISFGNGERYRLGYVHDYDLVRRSRKLSTWVTIQRWRTGRWVTAGELAERFLTADGS